MFSINRRALPAGGMAAAAFPPALRAESWPAKPIRWIVPYTAGGVTDVVTRLTLEKTNVGQIFVLDNKPGANSLIGAEAAANAAPDGYTFVAGTPKETTDRLAGEVAKAVKDEALREVARCHHYRRSEDRGLK